MALTLWVKQFVSFIMTAIPSGNETKAQSKADSNIRINLSELNTTNIVTYICSIYINFNRDNIH